MSDVVPKTSNTTSNTIVFLDYYSQFFKIIFMFHQFPPSMQNFITDTLKNLREIPFVILIIKTPVALNTIFSFTRLDYE